MNDGLWNPSMLRIIKLYFYWLHFFHDFIESRFIVGIFFINSILLSSRNAYTVSAFLERYAVYGYRELVHEIFKS